MLSIHPSIHRIRLHPSYFALNPQLFKTSGNRDVSNGPLAHPLTCSLWMQTHSLAPVRSLTPLLSSSWESGSYLWVEWKSDAAAESVRAYKTFSLWVFAVEREKRNVFLSVDSLRGGGRFTSMKGRRIWFDISFGIIGHFRKEKNKCTWRKTKCIWNTMKRS